MATPDSPQPSGKLGLIAGNGRFPFLVLESARRQKIEAVVAAIREETFPEIEDCGFPVHWMGLGQLGRLVKLFRSEGVTMAIMAGQVRHAQIFGSALPDFTMIRMLTALKRKNTDALIGGVAQVLEENGITLVDSTSLIPEHMAEEGAWTKRALNSGERADVEFGRPIAQAIAGMDIGQTLVVRDRAIVAVEAMEGTDAVIRRAGELARGRKLTVVKVSKPGQDMRFDVPVIGVPTVETMIAAGATALVVDAGRTLVFDKEEVVELANRHRVALVGLQPAVQGTADNPKGTPGG